MRKNLFFVGIITRCLAYNSYFRHYLRGKRSFNI